jgi:hypothetical protein
MTKKCLLSCIIEGNMILVEDGLTLEFLILMKTCYIILNLMFINKNNFRFNNFCFFSSKIRN